MESADEQLSLLRRKMENILIQGQHCDLRIECSNFVFNVHANIICEGSVYFRNFVKSGKYVRETHRDSIATITLCS